MDKGKLTLAVGGIALVLAVIGLVLPGQPTKEVVREIKETVGASPGPDISSPYLAVNGAPLWFYSSTFNTGSTTVCSFRGPAHSTTTVLAATGKVTTSSSSNIFFEWGHGAEMDATTTALGGATVSANTFATLKASTTDVAVDAMRDDNVVLAPNRYINLKYGGACVNGGDCTSLRGTCRAILIEN